MSNPTRLDRYQIVDQIGKGAMGVVYLAKDPLIGRLVALKTFHIPEGMEEKQFHQARDRFLREAQSAGILSHPNIVTIHDVVEQSAEGVTFFAMEYVRGTNLKQMLRGEDPLDLPTITDIIWQVAEALQYAHSKGVVHRDIKPANILITADRRAKLTDFGIARLHTSDLTLHGQLLGTPNYMAPEQVRGQEVDHRADIFSLGVVLYELLTRHKPFQGDHLTVVTHNIVNEAPTPPEEYVGKLPAELSTVLNKALAKDPNQRYQRVGALARDLKSVCDGIVEQASLNDTQEIELAAAANAKAEPSAGWLARSMSWLAGIGHNVQRGVQRSVQRRVQRGAGKGDGKLRSGLPSNEAQEPARASDPGTSDTSSTAPSVAAIPLGAAKEGRKGSLRRLAMVGGLTLLVVLFGAWLALRMLNLGEMPPLQDPEAQRTMAYLEPLQEGHRRLKEGEAADAAQAFAVAHERAPAERRQRIEALLRKAQRSADAQARRYRRIADIESSLIVANDALEQREFERVAEQAEMVLALEPDNEEALRLQSAALKGQRRSTRRQAPAEPSSPPEPIRQAREIAPVERPAAVVQEPPVPPPIDPNTPATMTIDFYSQVPQGVLTVYSDGRQLLREPFRFTKKTGFLRSKKIPGGFVRTVTLPPGEMTLKIYVALDRTHNETLRTELLPGSVVNLEVRVADGGGLTISLR